MMGANKTSFEIGNKAAEKWTESEVTKTLETMRQNAIDSSRILCLQDAILSVNLYTSSLNYLIDKFPVFENIKKDIQDIIVSRVNRGALEGGYQPTASIWRMKQLGETDERIIDNKSSDGSMSPRLTPEVAKAIAKDIDENI